jgi:plasmid stabilization system protein ParE
MPQVKLSTKAQEDIGRLYDFLAEKDERVATRAVEAIYEGFKSIRISPEICEMIDPEHDLRQLVIAFGKSGYLALYHYDKRLDLCIVLAIKHQLENDYGLDRPGIENRKDP